MHFKSKKYGEIAGWKPDRCKPQCLILLAAVIKPLPVCKSVAQAADRPYSHVVVTTKAIPELLRTPALLSPFLSLPYADKYPQPTYVLFQNGLNVEEDLYNALKNLDKGEPKVIGTAVYIGTNLLGDNIVEHGNFVRLSPLSVQGVG